MATNQFLPFALGNDANIMSLADYAALAARLSGFTQGTARSPQLNRVWRQSSFITSALAQFVADQSGKDVLDDGDQLAFITKLIEALNHRGGMQAFINPGVFTFTVPAGVTRIKTTVTAGGASGAGCNANNSSESFSGGGGGAGGTAIGFFDVTPGETYEITVGAGGLSVLGASPGNDGEASSFGSLCSAQGGKGASRVSVTSSAGGVGGIATGGTINITGGHGSDGQITTFFLPGNGASSFWGGGGRAGANGGIAGSAYGSGGGGAYDVSFTGARYPSGAGKHGIVVVEW